MGLVVLETWGRIRLLRAKAKTRVARRLEVARRREKEKAKRLRVMALVHVLMSKVCMDILMIDFFLLGFLLTFVGEISSSSFLKFHFLLGLNYSVPKLRLKLSLTPKYLSRLVHIHPLRSC